MDVAELISKNDTILRLNLQFNTLGPRARVTEKLKRNLDTRSLKIRSNRNENDSICLFSENFSSEKTFAEQNDELKKRICFLCLYRNAFPRCSSQKILAQNFIRCWSVRSSARKFVFDSSRTKNRHWSSQLIILLLFTNLNTLLLIFLLSFVLLCFRLNESML